MATTKDKIIVGATYSVAYECYEPSDSANSFTRTPLNPTSGTVKMLDVQTQQFVQLGATTDEDDATIDGNVISYTVPSSKTQTEGDYKLFTTAVFADGQIVTESRAFKILPMS